MAPVPRAPVAQPYAISPGAPMIPRIFPNLNAAAAIPVDRKEIVTLRSFFDHYRIVREGQHGQTVPNSKYIFCRLTTGQTVMHPRHRHPAIAEGQPVLYAGEVCFDNGNLQWWSNGSGNYRPDAEHAAQAGLPMDRFYRFEDVLKGVHKGAPAGA